MNDSEDDLLVYYAGPAAARPDLIPDLRAILLKDRSNFSPDFIEALDHVEKLIKETLESLDRPEVQFMFRRKLCSRCRDFKVVSGRSPDFPINVAKIAILTACDY